MPVQDLDQELEQMLLATDSRSLPDLEKKKGGPDNWVEKAGGLPSYIERIAKHLHSEKGMTVSRAIATAVNTVKRWCSGGSVTKTGPKGSQNVSAKTKALACKAVAQWEKKKASTGVNASQHQNERGRERQANIEGVIVGASDEALILSIATEIEAKLDIDDDFDFEEYEMLLAQERSSRGIEPDESDLDLEFADEDDFDEDAFQLALAQERRERGITMNLSIDFDPKAHPRDLKGQFRDVVGGLKSGESVNLPDGTRVTREGGSFNVSRKGQSYGANIKSADSAADEAIVASAKSRDKKSIGGEGSYAAEPDAAYQAHERQIRYEEEDRADAEKKKAAKKAAPKVDPEVEFEEITNELHSKGEYDDQDEVDLETLQERMRDEDLVEGSVKKTWEQIREQNTGAPKSEKDDGSKWDTKQIGALDDEAGIRDSEDGHVASVLSAIDASITEDDPEFDDQIRNLYDAVRHGSDLTGDEKKLLTDILHDDIQSAQENIDGAGDGEDTKTDEKHIENLDAVLNTLERGGAGADTDHSSEAAGPKIDIDDIKRQASNMTDSQIDRDFSALMDKRDMTPSEGAWYVALRDEQKKRERGS